MARISVCSLGLALLTLVVTAPVLAGSEQQNKEVVRSMIEAINARDFDALDNLAALTRLGHLEPPAPPGALAETEVAETEAEEEPAAEPSIDDFAWLVGRWRGEALGGVAEEVWLPPAGGAMSGIFRTVKDGAVNFYELFTLAEPGLDLRLKHFGADLVGWEEREEVVTFPFVRVSPTEAVFEGLVFRRISDDRVRAVVQTTSADGTQGELVFEYQRVE